MNDMEWICIESLPFSENSYLVRRTPSNECLVIDPGFEPEKIESVLAERGWQLQAILNTHGHSDHIAGNSAMKALSPQAPLVIGEHDADKLSDPAKNLSQMFGGALVSPPADQTLRHGEVYSAAGIDFEIRECPGHSRGHIVFVCRQASPWVVFGGDVLFRGGIGRTDFPDGDHAALLTSIREQLFTLPPETRVLPGHGPETTVGEEQQGNPFLR